MPQSIQAKTILNKTRRRDPWFLDDYTLNPYSGCSFNCLYCYIRGSKYGEHMEDKLAVKENAAELLDRQLALRARKNQYGIIVLSSATDPYLQVEKDRMLTRSLLEVILKHRFPVHVITKSDLVLRDLDLLRAIEAVAQLPADLQDKLQRKVFITFSFSTIDDQVGKQFEPGATPPQQRLQALRQVLDAGFHSGVSLMPLLPYITDTADNLEKMFATFRELGVRYLFPASLTLFGNGPADSRSLVQREVERHYPQLADKYRAFFAGNTAMPAYYQEAFRNKMKELLNRYQLESSLIPSRQL